MKCTAKTLIRSDSSNLIGHGHIRRDLVLAKKYKNVSFACIDLEGSLINEIPYTTFLLKTNEADELLKLINIYKFNELIIDHYEISYELEQKIKQKTNIKLTIIDDLYKRHFCDEIINPNIYADEKLYLKIVPKHCKIRVKELLVRDEFYKEMSIKREKIYDFFIMLGGADVLNLSQKVALSLPKTSKIAICSTSGNKNLNSLKEFAKNSSNISLFVDSSQVAKLMNKSKKLIITPSTTVHEALVLKANFDFIKVAKNQNLMEKWLIENGYGLYEI